MTAYALLQQILLEVTLQRGPYLPDDTTIQIRERIPVSRKSVVFG